MIALTLVETLGVAGGVVLGAAIVYAAVHGIRVHLYHHRRNGHESPEDGPGATNDHDPR